MHVFPALISYTVAILIMYKLKAEGYSKWPSDFRLDK